MNVDTKSKQEFENIVIEIIGNIFLIDENKILKENLSNAKFKCYIEKHLKDITGLIHTGFKIAQEQIIESLIQIQREQKSLKSQLKEAQKQRENKKSLQDTIRILNYKETLLKHLADTIFWHLIHRKIHIARRFYQNVRGNKFLEDTNYKSVLNVANEINSNPNNFVLLTDITNYVQIGDLFGIVDGNLVLIEVKEGEKNYKIIDDLRSISSGIDAREFLNKYKESTKDLEQIRRIIKQKKVVNDVITIINTDKGNEPTSGRNLTIIAPKDDTLYYYDDLHKIEQQLNAGNSWAYTVVDGCLHIGLYKDEWRILGKSLLETIAKEQNINHKIIVNAKYSMKRPNNPLLFIPFSKQLIIDILLGSVFMYLMIDIDKYMQLYENFGITCRWMSRKEAMRINGCVKNTIYLEGNRALMVKNVYGKELILSYGTFEKTLFNQIRPAYMAYSSNYYTDSL